MTASRRDLPELKAILIGSTPFLQTRLRRILAEGGFEILDALGDQTGGLGLIESPSGPEFEALKAAAFRIVWVSETLQKPPWPCEAVLHPGMSTEVILQSCNDVILHHHGTRRFRRYQVAAEVVVSGEDRSLRTTTVDASMGGVFVRTLNAFPIGSPVTVLLVGKEEFGSLRGVVVHVIGFERDHLASLDQPHKVVIAHPGMAIRFDEGQEDTAGRWIEHLQTLADLERSAD